MASAPSIKYQFKKAITSGSRLIHNYRKYNSSASIGTDKVIFSGIQPSGSLHLGNYFGAVKQWIDFQYQQSTQSIYCVVDLHAITFPQEPMKLRKNTLGMFASLLACGIDPNKSILFQQSMVPEHSHLCWLLGCLTTMPRLGQLPQYKEKSRNMKDIPLGLFTYPVLQSADILLYKATEVPVGEDQEQHVQLAQHLAKLFNGKFGEVFPIPHISKGNEKTIPRLKSLRNVSKKMSKSDSDPKSCIYLDDTPDLVCAKLKKALTDSKSAVEFDPINRPAVANLICLHSQFSGKSTNQICDENCNIDTAQYKMIIANELISFLKPIQHKLSNYLKNCDYLESEIGKGAIKAREISTKTMDEVKLKMGLL